MKRIQALAATALTAIMLAACQPPAPSDSVPDEPSVEAAAPEAGPPGLPCGIIAQRGWTASRSAGSSPALTISGTIDLPKPQYSVSLLRTPGEAPDITEPTLTIALTPPAGDVIDVVTPHPVHYFGPAPAAYTVVHITCDGQALTDIPVTP